MDNGVYMYICSFAHPQVIFSFMLHAGGEHKLSLLYLHVHVDVDYLRNIPIDTSSYVHLYVNGLQYL